MGPLQSVAPILKKSALPGGKKGCVAEADCALEISIALSSAKDSSFHVLPVLPLSSKRMLFLINSNPLTPTISPRDYSQPLTV